jgi:hypothetical protein
VQKHLKTTLGLKLAHEPHAKHLIFFHLYLFICLKTNDNIKNLYLMRVQTTTNSNIRLGRQVQTGVPTLTNNQKLAKNVLEGAKDATCAKMHQQTAAICLYVP